MIAEKAEKRPNPKGGGKKVKLGQRTDPTKTKSQPIVGSGTKKAEKRQR